MSSNPTRGGSRIGIGGAVLPPMGVGFAAMLMVNSSMSPPMPIAFQPTLPGYYRVPNGVAIAARPVGVSFGPMIALPSTTPPIPRVVSLRPATGGEALCGGLPSARRQPDVSRETDNSPLKVVVKSKSKSSSTEWSEGGARDSRVESYFSEFREQIAMEKDDFISAIVTSVQNTSNVWDARMLRCMRQSVHKCKPTLAGQMPSSESKEDSSSSEDSSLVAADSNEVVIHMHALPLVTAPSIGPVLELSEPSSPPPMPVSTTPTIFVNTRVAIVGHKSLDDAYDDEVIKLLHAEEKEKEEEEDEDNDEVQIIEAKEFVEGKEHADDGQVKGYGTGPITALHNRDICVKKATTDESPEASSCKLSKPMDDGLAKEPSPRNALPFVTMGTPDAMYQAAALGAVAVADLTQAKDLGQAKEKRRVSAKTSATSSSMTLEHLLQMANILDPRKLKPPVAIKGNTAISALSLPPLETGINDEIVDDRVLRIERLLHTLKAIPSCECELRPELNGGHFMQCPLKTEIDATLRKIGAVLTEDSRLGGEPVSSEEVLSAFVELSSKGPHNGEGVHAEDSFAEESGFAVASEFQNRLAIERMDETGRYFKLLNGTQPKHLVTATGEHLYGSRDFVDDGFFRNSDLVGRYEAGELRMATLKEPLRSQLKKLQNLGQERIGQLPYGFKKILRCNRAAIAEFWEAMDMRADDQWPMSFKMPPLSSTFEKARSFCAEDLQFLRSMYVDSEHSESGTKRSAAQMAESSEFNGANDFEYGYDVCKRKRRRMNAYKSK